MSLLKHRPKLTLQLPIPKINGGCGSSFVNLPQVIFNSSTDDQVDSDDVSLKGPTNITYDPRLDIFKTTFFENAPTSNASLLDFEKLCVLGHSNHGIVYKVRHKLTLTLYALKIIRSGDQSNASIEMNILQNIDSPFIIKCHSIFELEKAILMEYMDVGTLDTLLKANFTFNESSIAHIACQVLKGLSYLHGRNIVHLDIKPSNLLVDKDMNVKIADFGVSKIVHKNVKMGDPFVGTYAYMSPERLDSCKYDAEFVFAGDVWSLGVTLLELRLGHFPFGEKPSWMELLLVTCFGEISKNLPNEASEDFKSFIKCCLEKDPCKRWTVSLLLSHPFIARMG